MTDSNVAAVLELRRLVFRYPTGQTALDDVSFRIAQGERVALVGPSGAGKSTLLMHLNGLLPNPAIKTATESHVDVASAPVIKANLRTIRQQVGFLFQDPDDQLFCPTVREDVAFGPLNLGLPTAEIETRIEQSLNAVGLANYGTLNPSQLSTGERKRVCIAGVLACQPSILALDEPTSNLDPRARRQLLKILQQFSGTQIVATHDLDFAVDLCQRVIVLDAGQIHADGPIERILSNPDLMNRHGLEVPWRFRKS